MNRKLLAAAVGAALAAPAAYAAPELYGRANLGLDQYSASGATAGTNSDLKSRLRVYDQGSRFGVRGSEDLGDGLRIVYLLESGLNIDTGSQAGQGSQTNTSSGYLNSRIGHVGLSGGFGLVTFGRSNIWWGSQSHDMIQSNYVNIGPGLATGALGRGMGPGVSRQSNTLQYTTPKLGGVEIVASYSPNAAETAQGSVDPNGKVIGVTVQGAVGQISFGFDTVTSTGNTFLAAPAVGGQLAGTQPKAKANKLRAGFAYQPGAQLSVIYVATQQDYASTSIGTTAATADALGVPEANTAGLKQSGIMLHWEHVAGSLGFLGGYQKIKDITGCATAANCADTNGSGVMVGVRFLHSKSTWSYLTFNKYTNARNYNNDYTGGSMTSVSTNGKLPLGADPKVVGVGVLHNF